MAAETRDEVYPRLDPRRTLEADAGVADGSNGNVRRAAHLSEEGESDGSKVERWARVVNRPWKKYCG